MRFLVVGGTGLISTAIARQLLATGAEVYHCNRGWASQRVDGATLSIVGYRTDFPQFESQIAALPEFHCVIDLICHQPAEEKNAIHSFPGRTRCFLFCSTVDVYNKPAARYPITRTAPRHGSNEYGRKKIGCDDLFLAAHARGDLNLTIIRAFRYTIPWAEGVCRTIARLDQYGTIERAEEDPTDDRMLAAWSHLAEQMLCEARDGSLGGAPTDLQTWMGCVQKK